MFDSSRCVDACGVFYTFNKQKTAEQPWNPDHCGRRQPGNIAENFNIALAITSMPSDIEPPTSNPTKHGAATAGELCTPVKLITLSMVYMATSPFAQHKTLCPLQKNKLKKTTPPPTPRPPPPPEKKKKKHRHGTK